MTVNEIVDAIAKQGMPQPGVAHVPTPELVAFFVRWVRGLRQWKQKTLADFANVSLSTVERVERAEKVSDENLDRIAVALGYDPGYFTIPRLPSEDGVTKFAQTWADLEPVPVRRLCTHNVVRQVANCHAFILYAPGVDKAHKYSVAELGEWLQGASFLIGDPSTEAIVEGQKRKIYQGVLACVRRLERSGLSVLGGVTGTRDWQVAIIAITSKKTDPGAFKRRHIFVDRRWAEPQVDCPEDDVATLVRDFAEAKLRSSIVLERVIHGKKV